MANQNSNLRKVIDGDLMKVIDTFDVKDTEQVIQKYRDLGRWEEVLTDNDGWIVLYKNE